MKTRANRKKYRIFLRKLKGEGFLSLQKSVYFRVFYGSRGLAEETARIRNITPDSVQVHLIELPMRTFLAMSNLNCRAPEIRKKDEIICI